MIFTLIIPYFTTGLSVYWAVSILALSDKSLVGIFNIKDILLYPKFLFVGENTVISKKIIRYLRKIALFSFSLTTLLMLHYLRIYDEENVRLIILVLYFFTNYIGVLFLLYLSIFDFIRYEIPAKIGYGFILFAVGFNILIGCLNLIFKGQGISNDLVIFSNGDINTFLTFVFLYPLMIYLIKITKEKYMGAGDIDLIAAIILFIGFSKGLIFLLLFPILGSILGGAYIVYSGKKDETLIPLVPVLTISVLIVMSFFSEINELIFAGFF